MSFIDPKLTEAVAKPNPDVKVEPSQWTPTPEEQEAIVRVRKDFALGYQTMYRPRQEFSDLSAIQRDQVDFMAFNTYQPNNGENAPGDVANSWRSNAIRPIERNKCMSMAGHVAGRLGFLTLRATSADAKPDDDASMVVNTGLDWVRATYFPDDSWLHMALQAEVSPACIVHCEYRNVWRKVKSSRKGKGWNYEDRLDEANSGFAATVVPTDQFFIDNIYEKDVQKQRFVIWRRVQSHSQLEAKYGGRKNWKHVRKGMQLVFNDPNQGFYFAYDSNLRGELGEEVTYWSKDDGGMRLEIVNGVLLSEPDERNPREDGLYPFAKMYYSWIRDNFFYGKSLVFSVSKDANIINTLYPVLVDGAILDTMKPMKYIGRDVIGSDVIVPGQTVSLTDRDSKLEPLMPPLSTGNLLNALMEVEKSIDATAQTQALPQERVGDVTAYEISRREMQLQQDLGPFLSELVGFSVQMTRLVMGDFLQHMTVADVSDMQGMKSGLKYKSFLVDLKKGSGAKSRRVKFERLPPGLGDKGRMLEESYKLLEEQGGIGADTELVKADPVQIRKLKYSLMMTDDVMRPKSDEERFRRNLETLDRAINAKAAGANLDLDELCRKLLFTTNPVTARNPDDFVLAGQPMPQAGGASAVARPIPVPGAVPGMPTNV